MQRQHWQDAYDTQLALWRLLDTDPALTWLRQKFRAEVIDLDRDMQLLMADIYSVEYAKLRTATPFYVSGEMCEVAEAASKSFEPEALLPTDFLVPTGFLYFEKPFEILDRYGRPIQLAGFSWSPLLVAEDVPSGNATLVQSDGPIGMEFLVEHHKQTHENGSAGDGVSLCLYVIPGEWESEHLGPVPPLLPTHFTPWPSTSLPSKVISYHQGVKWVGRSGGTGPRCSDPHSPGMTYRQSDTPSPAEPFSCVCLWCSTRNSIPIGPSLWTSVALPLGTSSATSSGDQENPASWIGRP